MSPRPTNLLILAIKIFAAIAIFFVAACSFSPVYSDKSASSAIYDLSFDRGDSRLEQIVYADLVAHFGRSGDPEAKNVHIIVTSSAVTPGGSVGLKGVITITDGLTDEILFTGTRTASATYVGSGQSLANQQASNEASERAAHQLAETIRLTLIGVLSFPSNQ